MIGSNMRFFGHASNSKEQFREHLKLAILVAALTFTTCFAAWWNFVVDTRGALSLPARDPSGASANLTKPALLTMKIATVVPRVDEQPNNDHATLVLVFKNRSNVPIRLPCYANAGKGSDKITSKSFMKLGNEQAEHDVAGCYAPIRYEWSHARNAPVIGSYDITSVIAIQPRDETKILVPVKVTTDYGKYVLRVSFDNRVLSSMKSTFNSSQSDGDFQYTALDSESLFDIGQ